MFLIPLLLNNWKLIAVGLAIAAFAGYIGLLKHKVNSLTEDLAASELVIAKYKDNEEKLVRQAAEITKQHEAVLKDFNAEVTKNAKLTQDKIKLNKELNSVLVTLNAVKLFNESKSNTSPPDAVKGDDAETSGTPVVPLASLFSIVAENDANHLKCVKQVEEWQVFWTDFASSVREVRSD